MVVFLSPVAPHPVVLFPSFYIVRSFTFGLCVYWRRKSKSEGLYSFSVRCQMETLSPGHTWNCMFRNSKDSGRVCCSYISGKWEANLLKSSSAFGLLLGEWAPLTSISMNASALNTIRVGSSGSWKDAIQCFSSLTLRRLPNPSLT